MKTKKIPKANSHIFEFWKKNYRSRVNNFIKEQLEYLNELSKNFKQENNRLAKIISNHNSNLNNEILEILDRK